MGALTPNCSSHPLSLSHDQRFHKMSRLFVFASKVCQAFKDIFWLVLGCTIIWFDFYGVGATMINQVFQNSWSESILTVSAISWDNAILNPCIINFILNFNWNFISPPDFFKFIFSPFQNILIEFRRPNFKLFCKSCKKCFIVKLIIKKFIQ